MRSSTLSKRPVEIGLLDAIFGFPFEGVAICEDTCSKSGPIIASETYKHDAHFRHSLLCGDSFLLKYLTRDLFSVVKEGEAVLVAHSNF